MNESFSGIRIGYVMTGSYCTFERSFRQAERLIAMGAELLPVMSENAAGISTRFGSGEDNVKRFSDICGKEVITSIDGAEPIGPKNLTDIMVVSPCTSNTAAKLAAGITDSPVIMKSTVRFIFYILQIKLGLFFVVAVTPVILKPQ